MSYKEDKDLEEEGGNTPQAITTLIEEVYINKYTFTEEESRSLVRKLDWHILPYIWWCYIFNSLDRSNVSNAKSDGMPTDLNFPDEGYAIMLSVFYVPFCLLVVPSVMLTRKIGPKWTIPGYMIGWGGMAMINAGCKNFAGVLAVRLCKLLSLCPCSRKQWKEKG